MGVADNLPTRVEELMMEKLLAIGEDLANEDHLLHSVGHYNLNLVRATEEVVGLERLRDELPTIALIAHP